MRLHEEYSFELALETCDTVGMSKGCGQSILGLRACNRKRSRSNLRDSTDMDNLIYEAPPSRLTRFRG